MAASFPLILDTTPPQVSWGYSPTLRVNESYELPYTVNEPALTDAYLEDALGNRWALHVGPDRIEFSTNVNVALGPARIVAVVRDEVWNEAERTLPVMVVGTVTVIHSDSTRVVMAAEDYPPEKLDASEHGQVEDVKDSNTEVIDVRHSDRLSYVMRLEDGTSIRMAVSDRGVD